MTGNLYHSLDKANHLNTYSARCPTPFQKSIIPILCTPLKSTMPVAKGSQASEDGQSLVGWGGGGGVEVKLKIVTNSRTASREEK